jgi:lipoprotein-anchoring transpeptidase ErfK/SrfK
MTYKSHRSHQPKNSSKHISLAKIFAALFVVVVLAGFAFHTLHTTKPKIVTVTTKTVASVSNAKQQTPSTTVKAAPNDCASNTLSQNLIVSINAQHLWACDNTTLEYDTAVITGAEPVNDGTPIGTYQIYAKYTNQVLKGCDTTGCWSDPVSYWMPFLEGSDGPYGLHDATWRTASQFGNISPESDNGSHGCVELPLAAATWIYNWASVGTTVTIES